MYLRLIYLYLDRIWLFMSYPIKFVIMHIRSVKLTLYVFIRLYRKHGEGAVDIAVDIMERFERMRCFRMTRDIRKARLTLLNSIAILSAQTGIPEYVLRARYDV